MRTEDDLRAALTALERHAPDPAAVLAAPPRRRHFGQRPRSQQAGRWLAGVITAAALAGVITALTLPGGTVRIIPNGRVASPSGPTAPASLRAKLLAAFSATSGEIVYERSTFAAGTPMVTENWYYPWQASPGQPVRSRQLVLNSNGTPYQDVEDIYTMPAPGTVPAGLPMVVKKKLRALLNTVVAATGEIIGVEYGNRTWSDQKHHALLDSDPASPQAILAEIKDGQWTYVGTMMVDGHKAIELDWKSADAIGYLWVDASNYLPLRERDTILVGGPGKMTTTIDQTDYTLLAVTPANLALLAAPIPRGFTRTSTQVLPYPGRNLG